MDSSKMSKSAFEEYVYDAPARPESGKQTGSRENPSCDGDDYFGGVYDYIRAMLMEEDDELETRPCMFQDCSALMATQEYFHAALNDSRPEEVGTDSLSVNFCSLDGLTNSSVNPSTAPEAFHSAAAHLIQGNDERFEQTVQVLVPTCAFREETSYNWGCHDSGRKKSARDDDSAEDWGCRRKQLSSYAQAEESLEKYDKSLLCRRMNPGFYTWVPEEVVADEPPPDSEDESMKQYRKMTEVKRGRPKGSKKVGSKDPVVDLRGLLTRCAEAVSVMDTPTAEGLLKQIRKFGSPVGDPNQRLAHCFANALQARLAGTGPTLYAAIASRRVPATELLNSYQSYVQASPFKRMSNLFANKSIGRHVGEAGRIHIIDFGILYGFQWPCIIQGFSLRPKGSPLLKITGIDFPQPGFKPAERVEQTGRRLMSYCKRFSVPFEYNAIAKRWDNISIEDLRIERDETLVVNCMYRLRHMPDESAGVGSQRDAVLKLIRKINPDLFVHGVVNGTYSAPFFTTRFREALYHFSSYFDMLESTLPREDQDRLLYEREVFGRDVMNVIACEGSGRIERPETYKQWKLRNQRAGFEQMPLNQQILKEVKAKVRKDYHSYFLLDEDSGWMLQGWKGRVMYALSCWKPSRE